jgi:two-component system cell cycle sensor histidine kinase PleC
MSKGHSSAPDLDPRILKVQAERAAKAIRGTVISSPAWACFAYIITSSIDPILGTVPLTRGLILIAEILIACGLAQFVLRLYRTQRDQADAKETAAWLDRLLGVNIALSAVWGTMPWLLWDPVHHVNHLFVELLLLAVVTRFLVSRANHMRFLLGSFLPMAILLFIRCVLVPHPVDMVLALIVPLYMLQVFWESSAISQRWDEEARMRFLNEDISSELEDARDEALRKRAEAEAANASKTAFLANMSHELRTPLNAILGFSEIIARECLGPVGSPRYKEYAGDIHNSGAHLLSLINDLLDVAKIEAGRMEIEPHTIETQRALDHAVKFLGSRVRERNQQLSVHLDAAAAELYADERALKQIVINLVSNAVKFTQAGGIIDVTAKRNARGEFELLVADNGPGIAREKLDRIFKPFTRIDNRYDSEAGGTGLGLALVRGLAELHGGRAWIESEEGKGVRAFVTLPMKAATAAAAVKLRA